MAAAVAFLLALLKVHVDVDLIALGLFLLSLHLIVPVNPWRRP